MWSRCAIAALMLVLCCPGTGMAQTADMPVMGTIDSDAQETPPAADETPDRTQILVVGDAIGGGLGAGLQRVAEADGGYEVTIRFNEESGLVRSDVYDWGETLPKILEGKSYDIVVVLLGTNDRQQIRAGNARFAFNSPDWVTAYKTRLDRIMDGLAASGTQVYWIGIPPMGNPDYDAAMQAITALQKERAEAKGITFLDFRAAFTNPDGSYTDTGADDTGAIRKLRSRDGVTFFKQGNNRMGQLLLAAIEKSGPPGKAAAQPVAARGDLQGPAGTVSPPVEIPWFGASDPAGGAITIQPEGVTSVAALAPAGPGLPPSAALSALEQLARPGSAAAKLFGSGESVPAPAGRVDDFTAAPGAGP